MDAVTWIKRNVLITALFILLYVSTTTTNAQASYGCPVVTLRGETVNDGLVGHYQVIPGTLCSGKQIYRQLDTFAENYIFFFDNEIEQLQTNSLDLKLASPIANSNIPDQPTDIEGGAIQSNDTAGESVARRRTLSSESDSSESSESGDHEELKKEMFRLGRWVKEARDTVKGMQKRQAAKPRKTAPWQNSILGWRIGPVSCFPYNAPVMCMDDSAEGPSVTSQPWMEYQHHTWRVNTQLSITCADVPSHDHNREFAGRQMIGFMLGISIFCICIMHALYKRYKKRPLQYQQQEFEAAFHLQQSPPFSSNSSQPGDLTTTTTTSTSSNMLTLPSSRPVRPARNHLVIISFPHRGPPSRRDPDLLDDDDDDEEDVFRQEAGRHGHRSLTHGDIVAPPDYEESTTTTSITYPSASESAPPAAVGTNTTPRAGTHTPPPTYEEATETDRMLTDGVIVDGNNNNPHSHQQNN